jgi:hypothetical protein
LPSRIINKVGCLDVLGCLVGKITHQTYKLSAGRHLNIIQSGVLSVEEFLCCGIVKKLAECFVRAGYFGA